MTCRNFFRQRQRQRQRAARQQHGELVAAQPRHGVGLAAACSQRMCQVAQLRIDRGVATTNGLIRKIWDLGTVRSNSVCSVVFNDGCASPQNPPAFGNPRWATNRVLRPKKPPELDRSRPIAANRLERKRSFVSLFRASTMRTSTELVWPPRCPAPPVISVSVTGVLVRYDDASFVPRGHARTSERWPTRTQIDWLRCRTELGPTRWPSSSRSMRSKPHSICARLGSMAHRPFRMSAREYLSLSKRSLWTADPPTQQCS